MRRHKLTPETSQALDWWCHRICEAEIMTGNERAIRNPAVYERSLAIRLWSNAAVVEGITEEYRKALNSGTLNEPIWSLPAPLAVVPKKSKVIVMGAAP